MVTTRSGWRTGKQQELSVVFSNISPSTSSQVQPQEIIVEVDGLQDPYLETINISTSEHLNIYNKAIVGIQEIDRYDLNRSKWTDFYQEF